VSEQSNSNTLIDLLEAGSPSHPAIQVPEGPTITYDSLRLQVSSLSKQLRSLGIQRTDRIASVLPNSPENIVSFLAVSTTATAAPLNPAYKADEFNFYLKDTQAKALITPPEGGETAQQAAPEGTLQICSSLRDGEVVFETSNKENSPSEEIPGPEDIALVLHTSGTTSRPKRVPLTHRNLITSVDNIVNTYQLTSEDASLCVMPLFHVHGLMASVLSTFASGGTVVVPPRFNALTFWNAVRDCDVTWFTAVPTMHQTLLARARKKDGKSRNPDLYKKLRFIRSCSASLPAAAMMEMEKLFGVPVLEAYGMTEASHQMSSNPLPPDKRLPGTVGCGTGVSIAIANEEGTLQPPGTRGEVVIQGPNVISGYEDNPEANASSFTNGWFRTGDEGVLDSEGYLSLMGRLKELINRSGEKISPLEIDEVLLSHPAIAEAVAFATPHSTHGEEPTAAVVVKNPITESDLISHCKEHLADFKCPRTIYIVDQIPRTATGKIQRRKVAEVFAKDVSE